MPAGIGGQDRESWMGPLGKTGRAGWDRRDWRARLGGPDGTIRISGTGPDETAGIGGEDRGLP